MEDAKREISRLEEQVASVVVSLFLWRWKGKSRKRTLPVTGENAHGKRARVRAASIAGSEANSSCSSGGSPPSAGVVFTHVNAADAMDVGFRTRLQAILRGERDGVREAARGELLCGGLGEEGEAGLNEGLFEGSGVGNVGRLLGRLCAPLVEG